MSHTKFLTNKICRFCMLCGREVEFPELLMGTQTCAHAHTYTHFDNISPAAIGMIISRNTEEFSPLWISLPVSLLISVPEGV